MTARLETCTRGRADRRRERGAALLISMLLLAAMTLIGFASLNTVMRDREVTGYTSRSQSAFYGADAAIAAGLDTIRSEAVPSALGAGYCLNDPIPSGTLPNGVTYGPDSTAPNDDICMLGTAEPCPSVDGEVGGNQVFLNAVWSVRTQGVAPGGSTSRIQATVETCHGFNMGGY
jgi:hypothetical protein